MIPDVIPDVLSELFEADVAITNGRIAKIHEILAPVKASSKARETSAAVQA